MKSIFAAGEKRKAKRFFADLMKFINKCKINLRVLLKKHLCAFGPKKYGSNMLIDLSLKSDQNLYSKYSFIVNYTEKEEKHYKKMVKYLKCEFSDYTKYNHEINTAFSQSMLFCVW